MMLMLALLPVFIIGPTTGVSIVCSKLETCHSDFRTGLELAGIVEPESSLPYCHELRSYAQCVKKTNNKGCRGDLNYHSTVAVIDSLMHKYRCAQHNWGPCYTRPSPRPKTRTDVCAPPSTAEYVHCGIFGDPHLKTFSKSYQTCGARGAWPLVDNKYLGIQVTNEPVVNSSSVTATTKVTIIIRRSPGCAEEKTFEATSDSILRPFFIDNTQTTGPDGSVQIKSSNNKTEKIEIYLRYIDTTLVVRRVGQYLGFSIKVPLEIAKIREENSLELCQTGCPGTEVLDIASSRGHQLTWNSALAKCKDRAVDLDVDNVLTDQYLDWCVFDVMTTGKSEFVSAAHLAEEDVLSMDPGSLQNRTFPIIFNDIARADAHPTRAVFAMLLCSAIIHSLLF